MFFGVFFLFAMRQNIWPLAQDNTFSYIMKRNIIQNIYIHYMESFKVRLPSKLAVCFDAASADRRGLFLARNRVMFCVNVFGLK